MKTVLVAGATGQLGKCVLAELKQRGYAVRAIARDAGKLAGLGAAETVTADLTKPETLQGVCDGAEFVISCAGAAMNVNNFGDRKSFYEVDNQGNRNLLAEARKAGVKKFVYVSLACAEKLRQTEYADAHEKFVEALRASGLPHTVVRPTGFFGFLLEILKFARKGLGISIGDGACRSNPIHEADVAAACVDALELNQQEMPVGGPDVLTRRQITEQAFEVLRRKPRVMSISPGLFKLMIGPLRWINPRIHALMDFGIAVTQIDVIAPAYGSRQLRTYFEDAVR